MLTMNILEATMNKREAIINMLMTKDIESGDVSQLLKSLDSLVADNEKFIITPDMHELSFSNINMYKAVSERYYDLQYITTLQKMLVNVDMNIDAIKYHLSLRSGSMPLSEHMINLAKDNIDVFKMILKKTKPLSPNETTILRTLAEKFIYGYPHLMVIICKEFNMKLRPVKGMCETLIALKCMIEYGVITIESLYEYAKRTSDVNLLENIFDESIGLNVKFEDEVILKLAVKNRNQSIIDWYLEKITKIDNISSHIYIYIKHVRQ